MAYLLGRNDQTHVLSRSPTSEAHAAEQTSQLSRKVPPMLYDREIPNPTVPDRIYMLLDGITGSHAFMVGLITLAIFGAGFAAAFMVFSLRSERNRHPDPYDNVRGMPFEARASVALRVLAACLPDELADPASGVRAIFEIDAARMPRFALRSRDGTEITVPGETAAIVLRILSPDMPTEVYGTFDREMTKRHELAVDSSHLGPRTLDDIDRRYAPIANIDSALARRRQVHKSFRHS